MCDAGLPRTPPHPRDTAIAESVLCNYKNLGIMFFLFLFIYLFLIIIAIIISGSEVLFFCFFFSKGLLTKAIPVLENLPSALP